MSFLTEKKITNFSNSEKRDFNVEYLESFENYYLPLNFKILFRDKSKYFSINLFPRITPNQKLKLSVKDKKDKDKELEIKDNEITVIQYFREDLYNYQTDLSEIITEIKAKNPNIIIKYYKISSLN